MAGKGQIEGGAPGPPPATKQHDEVFVGQGEADPGGYRPRPKATWWRMCLILLVIMCDEGRCVKAGRPDKVKMIDIQGDVIFGGMFPMHERGADEPCGSIKEEKGIQRMEAMLYALDLINKDTTLLPNISLGAMILDTCSSDTYALEQSMEFFKSSINQDASDFKCRGGKKPIYTPPKPVVGVIGAASSSVSVMIANILRLFKIPQISYASTSTELSDKSRFEYFSRVVPPDNFQAMAMVEVVKAFDWIYVSTVADEGDYGEKGIASFTKLAENNGICIASAERVLRNTIPEDFDLIIERLSEKPNARVVIMFVNEDNTRRLLAAAVKAGRSSQFLWVGSDSWGAKIHPVRDQEEAALGAITILPRRSSLGGFDKYLRALRPREKGKPCSEAGPEFDYDNFDSSSGSSKSNSYPSPLYNYGTASSGSFGSYDSGVSDFSSDQFHTGYSGNSFGRGSHGIDEYSSGSSYGGRGGDSEYGGYGGSDSYSSSSSGSGVNSDGTVEDGRNCRNVWFKEFWTQHFNCTFRNPLPPGRRACTGHEDITHEQEGLVPFVVDAVYALAWALHALLEDTCGSVHLCPAVLPAPGGSLMLQYIRNVTFVGQQKREVKFNADGDAPGSYFIYQYQRVSHNAYDYVLIGSWTEKLHLNASKMVWTQEQKGNHTHPLSICSSQCPAGHIRNFQDACCWSCVACPEHAMIYNETCKPCDLGWAPTPDKVSCYKLTPEYLTWASPWSIVPLVFSSLGLLCTLLTTLTFIRYNSTPVIMASGRELCYVLLSGIAICYLMTFVILAPPCAASCTLLRLGLGLGLCTCYSAIFTKTNRISRIFNRGMTSIKRPSYTSPRSQIVICSGLVSVQLIGVVGWLIVENPTTKETHPYRLSAVLTCGISNISLIISLGYNMLLILLCTVYAFKTRKIPENFNEAKYIGFTMYSTCIVWLAFIPIYFGTNNDYKIQLASMCMCVSISASVSLGCLFTPKVYIVIFQPYKNVRQGSGPVKGSANKSYGQSMRFTSRSQTAQSVLSVNHSGVVAPPPSTISQQVNGDSITATPSLDDTSIT